MPTKRKNIRVTDADTNVELYYRIEYHFKMSFCEMNEFLEDAAAFFAASRQKSGKNKG